MFTNLVESSSHAKEFKRRGSFVLITTVTYAVLLVAMGVVSVYAYDARLQEQNLEMVVLISPQDITPAPVKPASQPDRPARNNDNNNESNITERAEAMLSVNRPESIPPGVSTTPNKNPPIPHSGLWAVTGRNRDAGGGPPGLPTNGRIEPSREVVRIEDPPPAPPDPAPKTPTVVHKGLITSQALELPRPTYPPLAKQAGVQGTVSVQVLIDESGRVVSAKAVSGSPFLTTEAERAARQARFSPTILNEQPVKVSGVITYNFVLNR